MSRWIAIAFLLLTGCATPLTSPGQVQAGTSTAFDNYSGFFRTNGLMLDVPGAFPNITKIYMRGGYRADGTGEYIQLYVDHWSQVGWNFFDRATDNNAVSLKTLQIQREVQSGGNVNEIVAIELPQEYIQAKLQSGFDIRLTGSKGSIFLKVPAMYLDGFMGKFNSDKSTLAKGK